MVVQNGTEVPSKEGNQGSIERQVETLKRELSESGWTDPPIDLVKWPKKIGRFELSQDSIALGKLIQN